MKVKPIYDDVEQTPADKYYAHAAFDGQFARQPVYLLLDLRDGRLWIDVDGNVNNWHVLKVALPWQGVPTPRGANKLLDRMAPMAQAILDDDGEAEDDANSVARLRDALGELDIADCVVIWSESVFTTEWMAANTEITAETSDEEVAAIEALILRNTAAANGEGAAVCLGLLERLLDWRDELAIRVVDPGYDSAAEAEADADDEARFGPSWWGVLGVRDQAREATPEQVARAHAEAEDRHEDVRDALDAVMGAAWWAGRRIAHEAVWAKRDSEWHPEWQVARSAARAACAALVSDLVGQHGLTAEHIQVLTGPWEITWPWPRPSWSAGAEDFETCGPWPLALPPLPWPPPNWSAGAQAAKTETIGVV